MLRRWVASSFRIFSGLLYLMGGGSGCRFEPSCSQYGKEAVERFGLFRGGWLTFRRVLRCRPGGKWGSDPVPARSVTRAMNCEGACR